MSEDVWRYNNTTIKRLANESNSNIQNPFLAIAAIAGVDLSGQLWQTAAECATSGPASPHGPWAGFLRQAGERTPGGGGVCSSQQATLATDQAKSS